MRSDALMHRSANATLFPAFTILGQSTALHLLVLAT